MPLTVETATLRIGRKMQRAERDADELTQSIAELMVEVIEAAKQFRDHEAAKFAQPVLLRSHKALGEQIAVRGNLARVHSSLLDARKITMSPEETDCPDWVTGPIAADQSAAA